MNLSTEKEKGIIGGDADLFKSQVVRWICGAIAIAGLIAAVIIFDKHIKFMFPQNWDYKVIGIFKYGVIAILLCSLLCLYRVMMGPTAPDRAVSLDMVGTLIVGFCALMGIVTKRSWYIDIGIIWALQSFIGSLALAKYLEGRQLDE